MSIKLSINFKIINLFFFFICIFNQNFVNCVKNDIGAITYLKRYGYMNESMGSANLISESSFEEAIKIFQRFIGLNETGFLDQETVKMMTQPRCGNKDRNGHIEGAKRRRRYALQGSKWRKTDLTYRISKYSKKLKKNVVDREIARAFELWSNVTLLKFIPKKEGRVNIDIKFVTLNHLDGDDFDGRGGVLAHAYFPQYGGDVHFDDDEDWSVNSYAGTNLFQVACHEFGHSLGLGHSSVRESLMAPFYQRYKPNFQLHKDDVLGIQSLYGESYNTIATTVFPSTFVTERSTTTTISPIDSDEKNDIDNDLCLHGSIDAVTRTVSGRTFVFKGDFYWKIETNGLAEGYPRKISTDWDGLPGNLDAAITWADGKTFFFKGDKYWRFFDMKMSSGYPKEISVGFAGVPNNIDAAFVWSGNGKTYFFKGSEYWRFDSKSDPPVSSRYPKPIKNWVGLPNKIDAAFKWENGLTYFFKGTEYYRFNDADFEVDVKAKPPFPRQTSVWWFDCKSSTLGSYSRRKPISLTQFRFRNKNKNDLDISSSGSLPSSIKPLTSSLLTSSALSIDKANEKDWIRLGHPDLDQTSIAAAYYAENSSMNIFKLNYLYITVANILLLILMKAF